MALLEDLFAALSQPSSPWAEEALRRLNSGQELAGIDQAAAERVPRPTAPTPAAARSEAAPAAPSPQSVTTTAVAPATPAPRMVPGLAPLSALGSVLGIGGGGDSGGGASASPAPQSAPARAVPASQAGYEPDFSQGATPILKFLGLDKLGIDGGERVRMSKLAYDALKAKGVEPRTAELIARQPQLLAAVLPGLTKDKSQVVNEQLIDSKSGRVIADYRDAGKKGAQVTQIGESEDGVKIYGQWDPASNAYRRINADGSLGPVMGADGGGSSAAPAPAATPPAPTVGGVPPGVNPKEFRKAQAEAQGKSRGAAIEALPEVLRSSDKLVRDIDALTNHESLNKIIGPVDGRTPDWLPPSRDAVARLAEIQGQTFLQAYNALRGGGAITEKEGEKASAALARLNDRTISEPAFRAALKELRDEVIRMTQVARERAGQGAAPTTTVPVDGGPSGQPPPAPPPAPGSRQSASPAAPATGAAPAAPGAPQQQDAAPAGAPAGARRAPDGYWYVPDPQRPGKYLKIGR